MLFLYAPAFPASCILLVVIWGLADSEAPDGAMYVGFGEIGCGYTYK